MTPSNLGGRHRGPAHRPHDRPSLFAAVSEARDPASASGIRLLSSLSDSPRKRVTKAFAATAGVTFLGLTVLLIATLLPRRLEPSYKALHPAAPSIQAKQEMTSAKQSGSAAQVATIEIEDAGTAPQASGVTSPFLVLALPESDGRTPRSHAQDRLVPDASAKKVKEHRSSRPTAAKNNSGTAETAKVATASKPRDADVDLLEALVTHVRHQQAREAKQTATRARESEVKLASNSIDSHLAAKLKQCSSADPLEQEVCRVRACASQWGKQPECLPKKEKIGLQKIF